MTELTCAVLTHCLDYEAIAARRRDNFRLLAGALESFAVFADVPAGVVPLGFPIRHAQRDRVRQALFAQQIYPPVHWDLGGRVPALFAESHRLSREIMTLPCDQRYDRGHMQRIAACVRSAA